MQIQGNAEPSGNYTAALRKKAAKRLHTKEKQHGAQENGNGITQLFGLLNKVSQIAQGTEDLDEAISRTLKEVCLYTDWPIGHAYHAGTDGAGEARSSRLWSLDASIDRARMSEFVSISEETVFAPGKGMIGKVMETKEPVTIEDVTVLDTFLRAGPARQNGVKGCFAFPVLFENRPRIVLEFFSREPAALDGTTLEIMRFVGNQLNMILTRMAHRERLGDIAHSFEGTVKGAVEKTEHYIKALEENARLLCESLTASRKNARDAAESSEETAQSVQTVASAVEEMSASINEIASQVQRSTSLILHCADKVLEASNRAQTLNSATVKVEGALEEITAISGKVKLLSMNARIEAARAGVHGQGFSVVANEVKELSGQTEASVETISQIVREMNGATREMLAAMGETTRSIEEISAASQTIDTALEEQSSTTNEIAAAMQQTALSVTHISANLRSIDESVERSAEAAGEMSGKCSALAGEAETLSRNVETFLGEIGN
ncbi:histidine kinase, HAMP region:Bacterial chemotaxis sensory transducer [Tepidicaulis marinus]|uniref:Histidine kinase, HAMP region:Bacterial chemotaxis sensory transducer n=1 Tax=Tepidicaulis marinus TaxID=1333998 RepID=A0A081BF00_9HYPH|nr:methyl-accepting chemotaxis protein [Tepidicaulis marinus]GAK46618.1 histidine kinase, HAMP region:Bacterial chemotaxis sensory transducer [Tepidicaulis marinus]